MTDRAQHGPFCEKVTVICRMGSEVRCTCGFDDERAVESREQLIEMVRAEEWQKTRVEMEELRAESERHRQMVKDALYCLTDVGSETACRAILEGNGLEDDIAEEYKSDLARAREGQARAVAQVQEIVAASEAALKGALAVTQLMKTNAKAAVVARDFVNTVEMALSKNGVTLDLDALKAWASKFRAAIEDGA